MHRLFVSEPVEKATHALPGRNLTGLVAQPPNWPNKSSKPSSSFYAAEIGLGSPMEPLAKRQPKAISNTCDTRREILTHRSMLHVHCNIHRSMDVYIADEKGAPL
jgi:hypothetical protein